jgi:hypothetical protein
MAGRITKHGQSKRQRATEWYFDLQILFQMFDFCSHDRVSTTSFIRLGHRLVHLL